MKFFALFLLLGFAAQAATPDLRTLQEVGKIIHSEQSSISTDTGWEEVTTLMKQLDVFDEQVSRIMNVLCSAETNKSVLLIGEPDSTFKYYIARLAKMSTPSNCTRLSHVEVMTSRLQGYMYVGTTERLWKEKIVNTSFEKDVVLHFPNITQLIGIGTHMNQDTGLELNYSEALISGKLKSVAFINKYDYDRLSRSRHAYVLNSFKESIRIDEVSLAQMDKMVRTYFRVLAPTAKIDERVLAYLFRMSTYYRPNVNEPTRTIGLVENIIRNKKLSNTTEKILNIATPDPIPSTHTQEDMVEIKGAKSIALVFDYFRSGYRSAKLDIYDANTNELLETIRGTMGSFTTKYYPTSKLRLSFKLVRGYGSEGFKLVKALAKVDASGDRHKINHEDVRNAIMQVAQIPQWVVKRQYQVIKELPGKLDSELVGVIEGKRDVINQIKIGYVSGRTDEKSAGALMFVGPTGTGKSYLAKKTAEFMNMRLVTFDMTQYTTAESFDRFLDIMTNALRLYPYSIFLFEEIDKANVKILDRLYFMLDEGIFYDKNQTPLFARGAFILMTTNTGHELIVKERNNPELRRLVNRELQKHFRPSFLNRFDAVPIFLPFTDEEYYQLAKILSSKKLLRMKEFYDWSVTLDDKVIRYMGENGHSDLYGARPMERTIEKVISIGVSNFQLEHGNVNFGSTMEFYKAEGEHEFTIVVDGKLMDYVVPLSNNSGLFYFDPFALNYIFQNY